MPAVSSGSREPRSSGRTSDRLDARREYLTALDGAQSPTNPERKPKAMSPSDPSAAWTTRGRHKVMFGYSLNYLIDMEHAVIIDVEATPTRITKEVNATETMIERTEERFTLKPDYLASDVAYGTGEMLGWLVERGIDPHIPVWDKGKRDDGTFSRGDFSYDKERDIYVCPAGKLLASTGRLHADRTFRYFASKHDCDPCPLKPRCYPRTPARKIPRAPNEEAREHTRRLMKTEAYGQSRNRRKKIETLFGDEKHNMALMRLRLRGLSGAKDEFLLTATVQNLKRLAKLAAMPPPKPVVA